MRADAAPEGPLDNPRRGMSSNRSKEAIGRALITAGSLALLGAAYQRLLRRRVVVWGATRDEAADRSPGHELPDEMRNGATRAVTIDAPSEAIWPWLVQMGSGDGGVRTYDWIERLLWPDVRGAHGVTHELRGLHDGDVHSRPTASDPGVQVEILTPVGAMTTRSEDGSWGVDVPARAAGRVAAPREPRPGEREHLRRGCWMAAMEVGTRVMERRMPHGCMEERAEKRTAESRQGPRNREN
jgi:hypothetical protein